MAAGNITVLNQADMLKRWYMDAKNLHRMDDQKNPLLGLIDKDPTGNGESWTVAVDVQNAGNGAPVYETALANTSAGVKKKFLGSFKNRYDVITIDQKVISATKGAPKGAFAPSLKTSIDGMRRQNQKMTNFQLYRDQNGSIGQIGAGFTSATGTLASATKSISQYIWNGAVLHFGPNKDGTSLRAGQVTIAGKDDATGVFRTVAPTALSTQITSIADGDYVFFSGASGTIPTGVVGAGDAVNLAGLETWIPPTEALAQTTLFGCDRSTDSRALGGIRITATGESNEEAYIDAVTQVETYAGTPKVIFCHTLRYAQLQKEMSDRIRFNKLDGKSFAKRGASDARFSFKGLVLDGASGEVTVMKDPACQFGYSWILDPETLCLLSMDTWPFVRNGDGAGSLLRDNSGTGYTSSLFGYGEMLCYAPGQNGIIIH